jgi:hypothetical protein
MKDLFVLTADADMQAVFRSVLARPDALGIRAVDFDVDRHYRRDSGVYTEGPEFLRDERKSQDFHRFILALDHHGSGCHKRPVDCAGILQTRLDSCSFTDRSAVIVIEPELEAWLAQDQAVIGDSPDREGVTDPKRQLEQLFLKRHHRKPRPVDFEQIASRANLELWNSSPSFHLLKETLQNWFPRP